MVVRVRQQPRGGGGASNVITGTVSVDFVACFGVIAIACGNTTARTPSHFPKHASAEIPLFLAPVLY